MIQKRQSFKGRTNPLGMELYLLMKMLEVELYIDVSKRSFSIIGKTDLSRNFAGTLTLFVWPPGIYFKSTR